MKTSAYHVFVDGHYMGLIRAVSADNCVRRFRAVASKSVNVLRSPARGWSGPCSTVGERVS